MAEKKPPSPAQLAAREKFAAAARARAAKKIQDNPPQVDANDVAALMKRLEELEQRQLLLPQVPANVPVRSITKYSVNTRDYPDPRDRLFQEDRLKLKNFVPEWWALEWNVGKVDYDKDGVHFTEPRFEIELWHIMEDDEGTPSSKRYKVCSGMFFEDPDAFIITANQMGLEVPEILQKEFMDEMRYLIIRDWLVECFYPPKPTQAKKNRTEAVIGNRLVEVVEINSGEAENAFSHLSKA